MSSGKVTLEKDGDVAVLTLADPPRNAIGPGLVDDFGEALLELRSRPEIRAVVLTSSGDRFFSIGFDLPAVAAHPNKAAAAGIGGIVHGLKKMVVAIDAELQTAHGDVFNGHGQRLDRCRHPGWQGVAKAVEFGQFGPDVKVTGDTLLHPHGHRAAKAVYHDHQGGE